MGKSRKTSNSSFKRDKDRDAYYDDSHTKYTHNTTKGQKPSKGHRDAKARDEPSEYIDWDSL
jgi:hypothetical protein